MTVSGKKVQSTKSYKLLTKAINYGDKMRILRDKVLVKIEPRAEKVGTIYLPESRSAVKWETGYVEKVGADVNDVEVGEKVVYNQFKADKLTIEGTEYRILLEVDIDLVGLNGEHIDE